jgi:outer membrane translocation and assembly module TamA
MYEGSGMKFVKFLRLFTEYREMEKTIKKNDEAMDLSAAIILSNKKDHEFLQKKIKSDSYLIVSLSRYITALEGKEKMQAELIKELRERLNVLLNVPKNEDKPAK